MIKYANHKKIVSDAMKKFHAKRTPEQKAATSKKTSASITKWHADRAADKKKATARKMSKSIVERQGQYPPRMKKDICKKKSESFRKFDTGPKGREQRKYLGYLTTGTQRIRRERMVFLFEKDVPRQKNYCGVVTGRELECING